MMEMIEAACAFIAVFVGIVFFNALSTTIHFVVKLIIVAIFSYVIFEAMMFTIRQFAY